MTYTGFGGILLVTDMSGSPLAYDLACPVECTPQCACSFRHIDTTSRLSQMRLSLRCVRSSTEVRCRVRHTSINTGFAAIARCVLQPAATLSSSEIKYAICVIKNYLLSLSRRKLPEWWNGRHEGLKIPWPLRLCGFESHFRYPRGRKMRPLFLCLYPTIY